MNIFNVPKKVNRHVLKALNTLCDGKINKRITTELIINQVIYQMRDLVPVANIEQVVQNSLKNLSDLGLIERAGKKGFSIGRHYAATQPAQHDSRKRKLGNVGHDTRHNDDTLSDDDFVDASTRKRMRSNNKQLRFSGRKVNLPKVRRHSTRPRQSTFDASLYASDAWYLADRLDYDYRMAYDEDQLQNVGSANTDIVWPTVTLSLHSLEIHEIPCEANFNVSPQIDVKADADSNQTISGELKAHDAGPSGELNSHEPITVSPQNDISLPNTTGECADNEQQEQRESVECTVVNQDKLATRKPSKSRHFIN